MSEKFDRSKDQATVSPGNYEIPVHRQIFPLERTIAHFPTKGESSKNMARMLPRTLREIKSRNLILKHSRNTRIKEASTGEERKRRKFVAFIRKSFQGTRLHPICVVFEPLGEPLSLLLRKYFSSRFFPKTRRNP